MKRVVSYTCKVPAISHKEKTVLVLNGENRFLEITVEF